MEPVILPQDGQMFMTGRGPMNVKAIARTQFPVIEMAVG